MRTCHVGRARLSEPGDAREFWWWFALRPTAKRIADAMTAQMLPAGNSVSFDATRPFQEIVTSDDGVSDATVDASPNVTPLRPAQGGNG